MSKTEKVTEKDYERINELVAKALDKNMESLDEKEIKELQSLLLKLEAEKRAIKEKAKKENLSEVISLSSNVVLVKNALEVNEKKAFNELSPLERIKKFNKQFEEFTSSNSYKEFEKEYSERKAQEEAENLYKEHVKKYGNKLY